MEGFISLISKLPELNLSTTARDTSRSAGILAAVGLLLLTGWIAFVAAVTLFLAQWLGLVLAFFIVGASFVTFALLLLAYLKAKARNRRELERARVEARQTAFTGMLNGLPHGKARNAVIIATGVAAVVSAAGRLLNGEDA